jgi:hypothetical protein
MVRQNHNGVRILWRKRLLHDGSRERKKGARTRYNLESHVPTDIVCPTKPHYLKYSEPPKIVPPAGNQMFNHESVENFSHSDHNRVK